MKPTQKTALKAIYLIFALLLFNEVKSQSLTPAEIASAKQRIINRPCWTDAEIRAEIKGICRALANSIEARGYYDGVELEWIEKVYRMACVMPNEDLKSEKVKKKLQVFWEKYKKDFKCLGFSETPLLNTNILQFAYEVDQPTFILFFLENGLDIWYTPNHSIKELNANILEFLKFRIKNFQEQKDEERVLIYEAYLAELEGHLKDQGLQYKNKQFVPINK